MSKRNEKKDLATIVEAPTALVAAAAEDTSLSGLGEYKIIPRLLCVQSGDKDLKKVFEEGTAITSSSHIKVSEYDQPTMIVPMFFFTEFIHWRDRDDKPGDGETKWFERTVDRDSELAKRSRDFDNRTERYGDKNQFESRFVEHLNFVVAIYDKDHPLAGEPCVLSFSKGEFRHGRQWINAIQMRKTQGQPIPLWGQVWEMRVGTHENDQYEWFGFNMLAPSEGSPYIANDEVEAFRSEHQKIKEIFEARQLGVDRSDGDDKNEKDAGSVEEF